MINLIINININSISRTTPSRWSPRVRLWRARMFEPVRQIVGFCVFQHLHDARVLYVDNCAQVLLDEFVLDHFDDAWLCVFVQVVSHEFRFFRDALYVWCRHSRCFPRGIPATRDEGGELCEKQTFQLLHPAIVDTVHHEHLIRIFYDDVTIRVTHHLFAEDSEKFSKSFLNKNKQDKQNLHLLLVSVNWRQKICTCFDMQNLQFFLGSFPRLKLITTICQSRFSKSCTNALWSIK